MKARTTYLTASVIFLGTGRLDSYQRLLCQEHTACYCCDIGSECLALIAPGITHSTLLERAAEFPVKSFNYMIVVNNSSSKALKAY